MIERDPLRHRAATLHLDLPLEKAEIVIDILEDVLLSLLDAYGDQVRSLQEWREQDAELDEMRTSLRLGPGDEDLPW